MQFEKEYDLNFYLNDFVSIQMTPFNSFPLNIQLSAVYKALKENHVIQLYEFCTFFVKIGTEVTFIFVRRNLQRKHFSNIVIEKKKPSKHFLTHPKSASNTL